MEGLSGKARSPDVKKQILTALLATIPAFTYGIQIGWLSPMRPYLTESGITFSEMSMMAAALPLAGICGIPFFSYASDRFGRKICIIIASALSVISWTLKLISMYTPYLITARALAGLAAAGCFVVVPVYIKEIAQDSLRGTLASLVMTVCKLGVIFVYGIGMSVDYNGNQFIYTAVAGCHMIVFIFMPESPNFLLKIGRQDRASKTISWLRGVVSSDNVVMDEIVKLKEEQRRLEDYPNINLLTAVRDRPTFSALRMTLVLMAMQTLSGCFALMNYASDVFKRSGTEWSPNTLALLMGSLQLVGSFFTTMSIDKFGRKPALACSSLVVSLCMMTLATCLYTRTHGWVPAAAVCLSLLAYGVGLAPVPFVIMAEVFTFQLRARMAGVSMAFSFFCSSMTVLFYAPIADAFGVHVVFYTFAAVTLFGVVYTVLWVPETKGKSLEEIQEYWKEKRPALV